LKFLAELSSPDTSGLETIPPKAEGFIPVINALREEYKIGNIFSNG
jgi:hypothetical protein